MLQGSHIDINKFNTNVTGQMKKIKKDFLLRPVHLTANFFLTHCILKQNLAGRVF